MTTSTYKYAAFISYSHRDEAVAQWLHRRLESYTIPKGAAPGYGRQTSFGKRIGRVFRDREELPAGHPLSEKINAALAQSDALIVLCSPNSARSEFVNKEIEEFQRLGRGNRIFPVIISGQDHEIFSPALFGDREILEADMRAGKDGRDQALIKLLAGLMAIEPYDLTRREAKAQRKRLVLAGSALLVFIAVAILAGIASIVALQQTRIALSREKDAVQARNVAKAKEEEAVKAQEAAEGYVADMKANYIVMAKQVLMPNVAEKLASYRVITTTTYYDDEAEPGPDTGTLDLDSLYYMCPMTLQTCFPDLPIKTNKHDEFKLLYGREGPSDQVAIAKFLSYCPSLVLKPGGILDTFCRSGGKNASSRITDLSLDHWGLNIWVNFISDREIVLSYDGWYVGTSNWGATAFSYFAKPPLSASFVPLVDEVSGISVGVFYNKGGDIVSLIYVDTGDGGATENGYTTAGLTFDPSYKVKTEAGISGQVERLGEKIEFTYGIDNFNGYSLRQPKFERHPEDY